MSSIGPMSTMASGHARAMSETVIMALLLARGGDRRTGCSDRLRGLHGASVRYTGPPIGAAAPLRRRGVRLQDDTRVHRMSVAPSSVRACMWEVLLRRPLFRRRVGSAGQRQVDARARAGG